MKTQSPFDRKIEFVDKFVSHDSVLGNPTRSQVKDAAIFVNDTLELALASAKQVFEEEATCESAFAIYDRIINRLEKVSSNGDYSD